MNKKINLKKYIYWSICELVYIIIACVLLVKYNPNAALIDFITFAIIIVTVMEIIDRIFGEKYYVESDKKNILCCLL